MSEAQIRADMEALMARLVQTERALLDTRQQFAAVPKVSTPLRGYEDHWQSSYVHR